MRSATFLTLVIAAVAGCQEAQVLPESTRSLPIIDGEPATIDTDATVLLINVGGGFSSCSGSVIAPRVVVTAKHCLGQDPNDPEAPMGLAVLSRPSLSADYQYEVIAGRTTEGPELEGGDFAVLVVDRDIDLFDSPYYELSRDQSDLRLDDQVKLAGYGLSDASGEQWGFEKLQTIDEVYDVTPGIIYTYGRGACSGDSGGTLLDPQGRLAGVMTRADCAGLTISERVDQYLEIIDWALEESGICVPDPETCNGIDDDCDGFVDPGCAEDGAACVEDRSCAEGLTCMEDGLCAASCTPAGLPTCGDGRYCDAVAPGEGRCRAGVPGDGPMGAACSVDADCASLACSSGLCRIGCAPNEVACPFGLACVADPDLGGRCEAPEDRPEGPLALGDPCGSGRGSCGAGLSCAGGGRDRYCAPACEAGCPVGFHCRDDVCVRGDLGELGASCGDDLDCGDGTECVGWEESAVLDGANVCASACDGECPAGFGCVEGACLPERAVVGGACVDNEDCASSLCGHFADGARCTERCAGADACPTGTVCMLQEDGVNLLCRPLPAAEESGGCAVAPGGAAGGGAWLLALLFVALRRRRPSPGA